MGRSEEIAPQQSTLEGPAYPAAEPPSQNSTDSAWVRIRRHKVVEWTLAYVAFGYAALHGVVMLRETFDWPALVPRLTTFVLLLAAPVAVTLAWYHGHRAQHRVGRSELAILVALLLVAGSALWLLARTERTHVATIAVAGSIPFVRPLGDKSIAVLPFLDMSEKKDQGYFSDGMSEELTDLLAQIPDLQVIARTSAFYFKGKQVTVADVAKTLGAANVLEGSVRRAGNTIRVTVQLIRADNDVHLWSNSYDRDAGDIFKVQDEIAAAVVGALRLRLLPAQQLKDPYRSDSPEAYDQFLLCRQLMRRGTLEDYRRAAAAARKAIALDPGYAAAYAALAMNETNAAGYTNDAAGYERARAAAERAISLAPQLAAAYRARASVRLARLDFPGGRSDAERDLALAPGDSRAQNTYAYMLAIFGNLPEAIAAANKAIELDPLNGDAWLNLGNYLTARRDFPAAHRALERSLAISPDDDVIPYALGILDLTEGRPTDALAEFHKSIEAVSQMGEATVAYTQGDREKSERALEQLIAKHASDSVYQVAEVYAWRGEKDKAFEWLERAYQQHDSGIEMITYDPLLNGLRTEPRYGAMLKKVKLVE